MDNKYYTPTVEEFHVGFEFEFETGTEGWKLFQMNENKFQAVLDNFKVIPHQFRVKFLDKKDIESLGWIITSGQSYNRYVFKQHEGDFSKPQIILEPTPLGFYLIFGLNEEGGRRNDLFFGSIKNISELKRIMKQLGFNV